MCCDHRGVCNEQSTFASSGVIPHLGQQDSTYDPGFGFDELDPLAMEDLSPTPPRAPTDREALRQRNTKRQSAPRPRLQHRVSKPKPKSRRPTSHKLVKEALACPYYKYAPQAHPNCKTFSGDELSRVK